MELKQILGAGISALLTVCLVLLVLSANGMALVLDATFYARGEVQQGVEQTYGLSQRVLVPVNQAVVDYFGSSDRSLAQSLEARGADPTFFNERETTHMADVHRLVAMIGSIERASLVCGIVLVAATAALFGTGAVGRIGTSLIVGGALVFLLVVALGALTFVDFGDLFLRFHLMSFSNDFWVLDPRTDRLIQMFPFGFWRDSMLYLVLRWLVSGAGSMAIGGFLSWFGRRLL